jgi:hypothetical protein
MSRLPTPGLPWYGGSSFLLFVVLLLVYVVSTLVPAAASAPRLVNLLSIGAVFFGLRAVTRKPRVVWRGLGLTLFYVLLSELVRLAGAAPDERWDAAFVLIVFLSMLGVMVKVVMRREQVTIDKIFAAACVYLLMGISFGLLFLIIEQTAPGAFSLAEHDLGSLSGSLLHFSFTTLTSVGYGDIAPVSSLARSLSDIEAVLAQLYLAIVLARLVSLEITQGSSFDAPE